MKLIKGTFTYKAAGLLLALLLLAGCGQGEKAAETTAAAAATRAETGETLTVAELYDEITKQVTVSSAVTLSDDFITNYYGISTDKLEEYVFSMSEEATSAETIAIIKVKDEADVDEIRGALEVVIDQKRGEMEDYLPDQFEIVDKSSVKTNGKYVYLIISEQADEITSILEEKL